MVTECSPCPFLPHLWQFDGCGAHIEFDDDIDIAVDRALWSVVQKRITQAISNTSYVFVPLIRRKDPDLARLYFGKTNLLHVDIWLYNRGPTNTTGGNLRKTISVVNNDILFPLRPCNFSGHSYWCPAKSEEWLDGSYVRGWRVPKSKRQGAKRSNAMNI